MKQEELGELTDQELREEIKKIKPTPIIDAFFIGFLAGILIYSVVVNSWGYLTLIPLFMMYWLLKKPKGYEALKNELKKRKLS